MEKTNICRSEASKGRVSEGEFEDISLAEDSGESLGDERRQTREYQRMGKYPRGSRMNDASQQLSMRDRSKTIRELQCVIETRLVQNSKT